MNYTQKNKEAWEEAFDNRSPSWGTDVVSRLSTEKYPFLQKVIIEEIAPFDFSNKAIGQFCCNNGRELLSLMGTGAERRIGFDIAENQISFAKTTAEKTGLPCEFIACDILKIDEKYRNSIDFLFLTIGTLCWFKDLDEFFKKAGTCLKDKGIVIINDVHPVTNMLCAPDEEGYSEENSNKLANSYFNKTWEQNTGMSYITGRSSISRTYVSFSHPLSEILNSILQNSLILRGIKEYDYDISGGMFEHLDNQGIPLSLLITTEKRKKRII